MSQWAEYSAMVVSVSGHDAEFVMKRMAYSRGLQFRTIFWRMKGIEVESPKGVESPLETTIQ